VNVIDWALHVFTTKDVSEKLLPGSLISNYSFKSSKICLREPGRNNEIKFSTKKTKFPKVSNFKDPYNRAKAIAFFANHELEAIEMMCAAIIKFGDQVKPCDFEKISKGIVSSVCDEQKHLKMYLSRLQDFGYGLDDFSLNDFFWKQFGGMKSFDDFFSLMALTFEAANLDFCLFYEKVFYEVGDDQSAMIMREIYNDELSHVRLGVHWLNKWRESDSLWNYYVSHLPQNISPERSKGIDFNLESREMVGLDKGFIENLIHFDDGFKIPKRKTNYKISEHHKS